MDPKEGSHGQDEERRVAPRVAERCRVVYRILRDGVAEPKTHAGRTINLSASGHPFWIKTVQGIGTTNAYMDGVTGNGSATGTITFVVAGNAPAQLFYNCQFHGAMTGNINIVDP